jgi:hypothetical protein
MGTPIEIETHVLPGHRVEVQAPGLEVGRRVRVTLADTPSTAEATTSELSLYEFVTSLPSDIGYFKTAEEVARYLDEERDAWER